MIKFLQGVYKVAKNELVCMGAMIIALMYDVFYLVLENPFKFSLSEIGRMNYPLFLTWSLLTGVALLLNVNRLFDRIGYEKKLGKVLLYLGLFFLVLTFSNMSKQPILYWIHVSTAILFAVLSFAAITLGLLSVFNDSRYKILSVVYFVLIFIDVVFLAIFKQMAVYEFVPVILSFILMFFTNYTKSFEMTCTENIKE